MPKPRPLGRNQRRRRTSDLIKTVQFQTRAGRTVEQLKKLGFSRKQVADNVRMRRKSTQLKNLIKEGMRVKGHGGKRR